MKAQTKIKKSINLLSEKQEEDHKYLIFILFFRHLVIKFFFVFLVQELLLIYISLFLRDKKWRENPTRQDK